MKTIELKHLAPYLPYNLKFRQRVRKPTSPVAYYYENRLMTVSHIEWLLTSEIQKPILRPLSDLTEKVLKDIKKMMLVDFEYIDKDGIQSIHFPTGNISITSIHYEIVEECPLGFYNYLLKHHFDVFGLIEKGLAIDKNTL